ncbi:MAG: PIN domain-containing protein [Candidatus Diapherotrites archaeon]
MTEENELVLIDSNVLVYAFDSSEQKKHKIAKEILDALSASGKGVLSIQNLAEFYSLVTKKIERPLEQYLAKDIVENMCNSFKVLHYDEKTIINAIETSTAFNTSFWDALLAATMKENYIEKIFTEDEKDFRKMPWLEVENPFK